MAPNLEDLQQNDSFEAIESRAAQHCGPEAQTVVEALCAIGRRLELLVWELAEANRLEGNHPSRI